MLKQLLGSTERAVKTMNQTMVLDKYGIDWRGFEEYLVDNELSKAWVSDLVRYARRFYWLLYAEPSKLRSELRGLSPSLRRKVLNSLSWLARFLEETGGDIGYEEWLSRLRRARVRWHYEVPRPTLVEDLDAVAGDVAAVAGLLEPRHYRVFAAFMLATGLRPEEAARAWRSYHRLRRVFRDMVYMDLAEAGLFRRTKRAVVTLVHPAVDNQVPRRPTVSLALFRRRWNRICDRVLGRRVNIYTLRRLHATLLLEAGLHEWQVDLLQGRLGKALIRRIYTIHNLYGMWSTYVKALDKILHHILS